MSAPSNAVIGEETKDRNKSRWNGHAGPKDFADLLKAKQNALEVTSML